jgi:hypothetical protein
MRSISPARTNEAASFPPPSIRIDPTLARCAESIMSGSEMWPSAPLGSIQN